MQKYFIIFLSITITINLLFCFSSCKKNDESGCLGCNIQYPEPTTDTFIIEGSIKHNCYGEYYANKLIGLVLTTNGSYNFPQGLLTTTDSAGNFSIAYSFTTYYYPGWRDDRQLILQFPLDSFYILLEREKNLQINYTVEDSSILCLKIFSDSSFSVDDTLFYSFYGESTFHYLIGPFSDEVMDTITFPKESFNRTLPGDSYYYYWSIGKNNLFTQNGYEIMIKHSSCTIDTATIHVQ
jgi:hypothetical protein